MTEERTGEPTTEPTTEPTGGAGGQLRHVVADSPLGPLRVVVDGEGRLTGLYLREHHPAPPAAALGREVGGDAALTAALAAVLGYLDGDRAVVDVPLAPVAGTAFQRAVWAELAAIPYGLTRTYGEVAGAVGHLGAHRAVGAAMARNPRCLVVPCHRVVGSSGALVGWAGGVERKRWLLELEARCAADLTAG